jgi:alpha-methylacyl-CoA racemase
MAGPLAGLRIIEMAGLGPGPFAAMMLADHGAEVIRVERPGGVWSHHLDITTRSRKSIVLDLKKPESITAVRDLCRSADGVIEGFRPGVMERLGLGPEVLLADNPKLVYGRMTGWGQTGPMANDVGHDMNYIALSGALSVYGRKGEKPTPPVNMVGDFGGGGMMLAFGMVSAVLHAKTGGEGQVIDCAMTDGSALLMSFIWGYHAEGSWTEERGANFLDTGAHFYEVYETSDGLHISLGSIEPQFYAAMRRLTGMDADPEFDTQWDKASWPKLKLKLEDIFRRKTRDEWCAIMEGHEVCFAPILSMSEAPSHPHNVARETFVTRGKLVQPAPAPRYSKTVNDAPGMPQVLGAETREVLADLGYDEAQIAALT